MDDGDYMERAHYVRFSWWILVLVFVLGLVIGLMV